MNAELTKQSASWRILKQALDDNAFEGGELAAFGEYTVSWDTVKGQVAIADSKGWWIIDSEELMAIAAATPGHWLPIASAPKDGTNILATDGELVAIVWWDWEWRDHGTSGVMGKHDYSPTHWMHIPRLPN